MSKALFKFIACSSVVLGMGAAYPLPAAVADRDQACTTCHDASWEKPILAVYATKHGTQSDGRTPGCQACHGPSTGHLKNTGTPADIVFTARSVNSVAERNDACMSCHRKDSKRSHWEGSTHQLRDIACASCHTVHAAKDKALSKATQFEVCFSCHKEQRSQQNRPSRHAVLEGKVSCSDCHNPHGSAGPRLMKRDSVVDTCYQCHMEKRGPFVHNHQPVTEDCTLCHNPHGTVAENMLKARVPFLCHQCHTPHGGFIPQLIGAQVVAPTVNAVGKGTTNLTQGRSCMNCHTQVHGSNNPSTTNPTPQFMLR